MAATLAVVGAGLVAVVAFSANPATGQRIKSSDQSPDPGAQGTDWGQQPPEGDQDGDADDVGVAGATTVNFRQNALFTCFGANGTGTGTPTANTAELTANFTTITAKVTVHSVPGTTVSGQLTQSSCARLKFFSFTIPASGVGTTTVTDLRIRGDAFVWFNDTNGDFQITPEVRF
jgi:hypothetical protein